jgi:BCCT family betaine/carnitine transporter
VPKYPYKTPYKAGQDNLHLPGLDIHAPVFPLSALFIIIFVLFTLFFPDQANDSLFAAKNFAINQFDWLFSYSANMFVLFSIFLVFTPLGRIRIGGADAQADFSYLSWLSMLFAAGMGIGLMFWGVAEPLAYASGWAHTPLNVEAGSDEAMQVAMAATLYHWTLHPWAIYAIVGLSLAFFHYNKKLPLTIRSVFYPLFGERTWGWAGHIVDLLAVIATIFGLATSLGLGAQQASGGFSFLFDMGNTTGLQVTIIAIVSAIALVSVVRGLDGGVKVLSNINMSLAMLLLLFIIFTGPTLDILSDVIDNAVNYATYLLPLSESHNRPDQDWFHTWTIFYWAWWISWSPFVGMFIARVSKGRTVREFILAVLITPSIVTLIWMSAFGGIALDQYQQGIGELANGVGDVSLAMFQMFEHLPMSSVISFIGIILVLVFFITSSDSGSLVVDSITAGGKTNAPVSQRIFWVLMVGCIAVTLLIVGGSAALKSLQAGAVSAGLPFTVVLVIMCISLMKALYNEHRQIQGLKPIYPPDQEG